MARNEEKANSMLNRWVMMKQEERVGSLRKRPAIASECAKLSEAERWRHQLLREISQKVGEIQNPALGEHRIRDLNDDINRLIREKYHWERRIVDLGGANYARHSQSFFRSTRKRLTQRHSRARREFSTKRGTRRSAPAATSTLVRRATWLA
eukprot:TRINITY_DN806_c0_g1_i1.p1 TRINITY_DN806_c0_g1~~TRINITY_DN806_c0_g1_i1.p1  ORF type:complete len:164 (-),score=30.30 TRINITY_DN806_c0_g1_i1:468-923(-)